MILDHMDNVVFVLVSRGFDVSNKGLRVMITRYVSLEAIYPLGIRLDHGTISIWNGICCSRSTTEGFQMCLVKR